MRSRSRRFVAVSAAVVVHAGALWLRVEADAPREKPRVAWDVADDSRPIEITLQTPPSAPPTPPPPPATPKTPRSSSSTTPSLPEPSSASPPPESSSLPAPAPAPDLSPLAAPSSSSPPLSSGPPTMNDVVTGLDARGPRPSNRALAGALDFVPDADTDAAFDEGRDGAALAAARAGRRLQQDMSFDDVSAGLGDDWFHGVRVAAERRFQPSAADLDNPNEVTREKIVQNYLRDPTSWDDEARVALELFLKDDQLHAKNAVDRLPLQNSENLGGWTTSALRRSTLDDLLRRKEAGFSVRFPFEVDVHHAADGAVTAIDVLRTRFERNLVEQVRRAVEQALADAPPAPPRIAAGRPFKSHWLFVATWFIDPPRVRLPTSSSIFADDGGAVPLMLAGTFDAGPDGFAHQDFDVKLKTSAELLDVVPLTR